MTKPRSASRHCCGALLLTAAILAGCGRVLEPPAQTTEGGQSALAPQVTNGGDSPSQVLRPPRRSAWVILGTDTVVAEVARTQEEKERGLMNRSELPDGTGMLFLWNEEGIRSFWMSNTFFSLDVAFMDANLRIVDIQQMEAESTNIHSSARPAMFALEVPFGWLAQHNVSVGDTAKLVLGPL